SYSHQPSDVICQGLPCATAPLCQLFSGPCLYKERSCPPSVQWNAASSSDSSELRGPPPRWPAPSVPAALPGEAARAAKSPRPGSPTPPPRVSSPRPPPVPYHKPPTRTSSKHWWTWTPSHESPTPRSPPTS